MLGAKAMWLWLLQILVGEKHFHIWPDLSAGLIPNELQGATARKDRGRGRGAGMKHSLIGQKMHLQCR